jgi:hypothetical protein
VETAGNLKYPNLPPHSSSAFYHGHGLFPFRGFGNKRKMRMKNSCIYLFEFIFPVILGSGVPFRNILDNFTEAW